MDANGNWISGFSVSLCHGSAFLSELLALEHGLRLAWELGYRSIICATDCQEAITALNTVDVSSYWACHTIRRVKSLLSQDWSVTIEAIPRDKNAIADALACKASRDGSSHSVWSYPPAWVVPLLCRSLLV